MTHEEAEAYLLSKGVERVARRQWGLQLMHGSEPVAVPSVLDLTTYAHSCAIEKWEEEGWWYLCLFYVPNPLRFEPYLYDDLRECCDAAVLYATTGEDPAEGGRKLREGARLPKHVPVPHPWDQQPREKYEALLASAFKRPAGA